MNSNPSVPNLNTANQNRPNVSSLDQILQSRKVIITCGTGGVGKTTLSAAIAMRAAQLGRKTVVITIDPAKRLATSLGMSQLSDQAMDLTSLLKARSGIEIKGSLAAMMPDTRKSFENFVAELAPNPGAAERVLKNPIFQIFAKEFSGTNEYMALERLLSLHRRSPYDCIILDTPPSRNALAFLNAPRLLAQFFDERLIRWLVLPANKIVSIGMRKALGILENLTGAGFMTSLFDFAAALFEVQANFTGNLAKVTQLLESSEVGFLMVTTPTPETIPEAQLFIQRLKEHHLNFDGVALNRTLGYLNLTGGSEENSVSFEILRSLKMREQLVCANLEKNNIPVCAKIPELARDVHSVEDLLNVAAALQN